MGLSRWFQGNDTEVTYILLSNGPRPFGLVIATIEDVHGDRTHNIAIDCKNRLLFDPNKLYDNKTWPPARETFRKLLIKKNHSAQQIYRRPGPKTLIFHNVSKKLVQPKIKGALLPLYRR